MARYIVVRYGSNAANQSMCNRAVLGTVDGKNREQAMEAATELGPVYNNQHLELIPSSRARIPDWNEAVEADTRRAYSRQYGEVYG